MSDSGRGTQEQPTELAGWIEQRTGLRSVLRAALYEPIPGGARWAYIFGSGLAFLLLSQFLTGVALALYYVPASNDAHVSVSYIVKVASFGSFLRSLHSYGASALIVVLLLHVGQTIIYGAYKGRRELVWLAGCVLLVLIFGMAFTGCLLPWDQRAYFATAVGTNVMGEVPIAGEVLKRLLRGGTQLGTVTLSRFFVLHVFVLPALLILFVVVHIALFRRVKPAGPVEEHPVHPTLPTGAFYPAQLARDMVFAALLATVIAALAHFSPVPLGPKANPSDPAYLPRPEWYFLPLFQWLKLWPGRSTVVGIVVIPTFVTLAFLGLPFLDRKLERRPLRRPMAVGGFLVFLAGAIGLGIWSHTQDRADAAVRKQMDRQEAQTNEFMRAPFVPESNEASVVALAPSAESSDAAISKGRELFVSYHCNACHGQNGVGTQIAPALVGIRSRLSQDQIEATLHMPSEKAAKIGMPSFS